MEQGSNSSFWQKPAIRFLYGNVYGLLRTLRPRQWIKNGLVFMALLFDQKLTNGPLLLRTTAAFILFCMVSSTVYIINDLADIEKDKLHPRKRRRALPSGQLTPWFAILGAAAGVIAADAERFSPWLYLCTILLALFLAIGKRRNELTLLADGANSHRRILDEYTAPLLDEMNH